MTLLSPTPDLTGSADRAATLLMSLRADLSVREAGPMLQVGGERTGRLPVQGTPGARAVLSELAAPITDGQLATAVIAAAGENALLDMHMLLARLFGAGFVEHRLDTPDGTLARLRVVGQGATRLPGPIAADTAVRLSRFAHASVEDGTLTVRSPRSGLALDLDHRAAALLGLLATWRLPGELETSLPAGTVAPLLRLASAAGLLAGGTPEDEAESPATSSGQWAPHDLWLHAHSRSPRTSAGYGGTYHGRGVREPEPARAPARGDRVVELPAPDLDAVRAADPSFTDVLEGRRSRRVHDDAHPITVAQLGELLYRSARLRRRFGGSDGEEVADRPYPSGGAAHELELYPLITSVAGVEPGLYHYATDRHELELVSEPSKLTAGLVARARASAVMTADPQVLLLVTARFGRVMFKYETIAYSLVQKHVGVLYQTIYLVGEAMGLAVCGLGGGDAELFATASGLDFLTEGTVGELVLGSAATEGEATWQGEVPPS